MYNCYSRVYCRPFTTVTKSAYQNVTTQYFRHFHELRNHSSYVIRGTIPPRHFGPEPPTLAINQYAEMTRCYTYEDVTNFTSLIGDENPIHQSSAAATTTHNIVVPGLLVGSVFSAVIGTLLPGSIYVRQTYDFRHAVSVGEWITGRIVIAKLRTVTRPNSPSGVYMICHTLAYQSPTILDDHHELNRQRSNHNVMEEAGTSARAPPEIPPTQRIVIRGEASVWIPNV